MTPHIQGTLLILTSACLLAVSMNIAKSVIPRMPTNFLLMLRSAGALLLLIPLTLILGRNDGQHPSAKFTFWFAMGGLIWPGIVNVLSYTALRVLPVNVNRSIFQTFPAFAFVISIPLALGHFSWVKLIGVVMATAGGAGFALFNKNANQPGKHLARWAIGLVLFSALIHSGGSLLWKYVNNLGVMPTYEMNMWQHIPSLIFFALLAGITWKNTPAEKKTFSRKDVVIAAFSGLLLFGIGNTLFFEALKRLEPGPAGAIYSINILLTAGLARLWLKERWTLPQTASALMVLAAVIVLAVG